MKKPGAQPLSGGNLPTKREALLFLVKTTLLQARQRVTTPRCQNFSKPQDNNWTESNDTKLIAESRSALRTTSSSEEFRLEAGKIENLRVAASYLDKVVVPSNETFSFWAHVPRPTRSHGFQEGRELREGCIIPSTGGGLCQLSNALYECALQSDFEIVERHGHSQKVPGSMAAEGRDATLFWNYVDLKFRDTQDWQLRTFLTQTELVVQIFAAKSAKEKLVRSGGLSNSQVAPEKATVNSCETCGVTSCFRHISETSCSTRKGSVWAVDAFTPEFGQFLAENHFSNDWLLTPLSSRRRFAGDRYPWDNNNFERVIDFPGFVLHRSIVSRRLTDQGAARQKATLRFHRSLAKKMIKQVPYQTEHLVISLELLPYFWESGALGGRRFDVMLTRPPMFYIQEQLDKAAEKWQQSPTLRDFRADNRLLDLEKEALESANSWISPNPVFEKFAPPEKFKRLPWILPDSSNSGNTDSGSGAQGDLVFPATTAGRNGVYELREAIRELDIPLKLRAANVESPDFWNGCDVSIGDIQRFDNSTRALVFPMWISNRPSQLLSAIAAGIPVITTNESGLSEFSEVTSVTAGDISQLTAALQGLKKSKPTP